MKSLADELPPDIAAAVHPDWRRNEAAYWDAREALLADYRGAWVAFADGRVVASGTSPVAVLAAAHPTGRHPFLTCVGREDEPCRLRRVAFPFDAAYPGEPLPLMSVEFRAVGGTPGVVFDRVIPDTGADTTAPPWPDCLALGLDAARGLPGRIAGVGGTAVVTVGFFIWVWLDGREYPRRLQADSHNPDRILGRDVLNRVEVLFRGPACEVVVNPWAALGVPVDFGSP